MISNYCKEFLCEFRVKPSCRRNKNGRVHIPSLRGRMVYKEGNFRLFYCESAQKRKTMYGRRSSSVNATLSCCWIIIKLLCCDFRCNTGRCLPKTWVCDGTQECNDGSDEPESCKDIVSCDPTYFKCNNSKCIPGNDIKNIPPK